VVQEEPAVLDVYQHSRYEVENPEGKIVNAAAHVEGEVEVEAHTTDEESKGIIGKIGDGIKNLF